MATKNVGNSFPYHLADQGLKKYQASDRFRLFLAMKMAERAEIEMTYVRHVQKWINDLNIRSDNSEPSDRYLTSDVMEKILGSMRTEAAHMVEFRQRVYNQIMSDNGPHTRLQHLHQDADDSQVTDTEAEFHRLFDKRTKIANTQKKHLEAREHLGHQIETLETQLSERSRITSSRRPSAKAGPRKIDEMRDRLSHLRRQNDSLADKITSYEEELLDAESSAKSFLDATEKRVRGLETDRIKRVIAQTRRYLHMLEQPPTQSRSASSSLKEQLDRTLENAENVSLKVHWLDVHTNAKRGDMPDFRDMFRAPSVITRQNKKTKDSIKSGADTGLSKRRELTATESVSTYFSFQSSSGSSVDADIDSVVSEAGRLQNNRMTSNQYPVQLRSQESIETLPLPPEVRCPADISVLEPNRQYTTRMKVSKFRNDDTTRQGAHLTEYCQVNQFEANGSESDEDSDDHVGNLRNVRVIAMEDNSPGLGGKELTFRKGQIIKQKTGANENGLCYGWTRENRVGRKQYGYYKQHKVKLFRKMPV